MNDDSSISLLIERLECVMYEAHALIKLIFAGSKVPEVEGVTRDEIVSQLTRVNNAILSVTEAQRMLGTGKLDA